MHTFKDGGCWRIVTAISLVLFGFPAPDLNIGKFKSLLWFIMSPRHKQEYVSISNFHTQLLRRTLTPHSHLHFKIVRSCFKQSKHGRKQLKMDEKWWVYLNFFYQSLRTINIFFKCLFHSHQVNGWISRHSLSILFMVQVWLLCTTFGSKKSS